MRWQLILILCVFATLFLTSCGGEKEEEIALVVIVGNHANSNKFTDKQYAEVSSLIESAFETCKGADGKYYKKCHVYVVVSDGNPESVTITKSNGDSLPLQTNTTGNEKNLKTEILPPFVSAVNNFIKSNNLRADDDENDLLGAIRQAKLLLGEEPDRLKKYIVILDTGITTAGTLDMRRSEFNIQDSSVDEIIKCLDDKGAVPDLSDITVRFMGLGNVAYPQEFPQNQNLEDKLCDLWTQIIELRGGTMEGRINFSASGGNPMEYPDYPYVSAVSFGYIEPSPAPEQTQTPKSTNDEPPLLMFSAIQIGFEPNSAEFKEGNEENSIRHIKNALIGDEKHMGYIQYLNENPDKKLYVVGSIARVTTNRPSTSDVSRDRADKIKAIIQSEFEGLENRIIAIDAGAREFSWRNTDEFQNPDPQEQEKNREKNRVVAIFCDDNESEISELTEKLTSDEKRFYGFR